jgi:hypothetical protein
MVQSHVIQAIVGVFSATTLGVIIGSLIAIWKLKAKTEEVKKDRIEVEIRRAAQQEKPQHESGMMAAHR